MLLPYFFMLFFFFCLSSLSKDCMCYDRHGDAFVVARTSTTSSHRFSWRKKAAMTRKTLLHCSTTALSSSSSNQMEEEEEKEKDTEELMTPQHSIIQQQQRLHIIGGITFREIPMDVPKVGTVTILEATSEAQEDLVNMVLLDDDDNNNENGSSSLISAGDPYGAVLWPAAWAVANYLIGGGGSDSEDDSTSTNKSSSSLDGKSILELGAGTGLVSIAMALAGAKKVVATDFEPLPLTLTKYAAKEFHNLTTTTIDTQLLDLCDRSTPLPYADIVVAADIMYEPKTGRAMAHRVLEALQQNSRVVVGDSPGRAGRPTFLQTLNDELGLPKAKFKDTIGRTISSPRHDLICGKGSSSVSETPKELTVAIMDLHPSILLTS